MLCVIGHVIEFDQAGGNYPLLHLGLGVLVSFGRSGTVCVFQIFHTSIKI